MAHLRTTPPGLSGIELYRTLPKLRRDTLRGFTDLTARFGHVVRFKGLWTTFILTHPQDIEHVLQTNAGNYRKGRSYRVMRESTGNGLFVSEGEFWRRQRRLAQPAFHRGRIAGFARTMAHATAEMLAKWDLRFTRGEAFDVFSEMSALTLRIVGRTLFSTELAGETDAISRMLAVGQDFAIRRMWQTFKLPLGWPLPAHRRFRSAMQEGDRIIYEMINEWRLGATEGQPDDLLQMLMGARDEATGEGMSDRQLRDEAFTIMVAGHETTALTLAWTWYLLAHHPHIERKLHAETASVLKGRAPTFEDLPDLKYASMVIQETLRMYPPAWALGRTSIEADEVGGYHVPAKSEMLLFTYTTHHHADFWESPDEFIPERFAPEQVAARQRFAYFPFGGGPRMCIGNNFALMEAQLVLAMIAQKYRLRLVDDHTVEPDPTVTLRPRTRIVTTLERV